MTARALFSTLLLGTAALATAQTPRRAAEAPPLGRYDCRDEITGPLRTMGWFTLSAGGTYQYLDKAANRGRYRFDPSTGVVAWLSGPYAKDADGAYFHAEYRRNSAGRAMVTLRLVSPGVKYADTDYCFLRTS
ncbi:MAG TPA: hypothetical protein VF263_17170 [Longimicrobiaceae bacterium]